VGAQMSFRVVVKSKNIHLLALKYFTAQAIFGAHALDVDQNDKSSSSHAPKCMV
jgi:hypothetical protein